MFGLAIAYYAVSGAIRMKPSGFREPEAIGVVSWDGAWGSSRCPLKRLEAPESTGDLDKRTYDKLRTEYETKVRKAIELP